jgi:hypothetical protein
MTGACILTFGLRASVRAELVEAWGGLVSNLLESGGSMPGLPRSGSSPLRWRLNSSSSCGSAVLRPDRIPAVGAYGPDRESRNAPPESNQLGM